MTYDLGKYSRYGIKAHFGTLMLGGFIQYKMKGTKVQTLGGRAVAGAWLVAWAIMAMGAIINTHAHR